MNELSVIANDRLYDMHSIKLCQKGNFYFILVDGKQAYKDVVFSNLGTAQRYFTELRDRIRRKRKYVACDDPKKNAPWTWLELKPVDEADNEKYKEALMRLVMKAAEKTVDD